MSERSRDISSLSLWTKELGREADALGLDTVSELSLYNPLRDGSPSQGLAGPLVELANQARRALHDRVVRVGNKSLSAGTRLYDLPNLFLLPVKKEEYDSWSAEQRLSNPFPNTLMFPRGCGSDASLSYAIKMEEKNNSFSLFHLNDENEFEKNPNFLETVKNSHIESESPYYLYGSGSSSIYVKTII